MGGCGLRSTAEASPRAPPVPPPCSLPASRRRRRRRAGWWRRTRAPAGRVLSPSARLVVQSSPSAPHRSCFAPPPGLDKFHLPGKPHRRRWAAAGCGPPPRHRLGRHPSPSCSRAASPQSGSSRGWWWRAQAGSGSCHPRRASACSPRPPPPIDPASNGLPGWTSSTSRPRPNLVDGAAAGCGPPPRHRLGRHPSPGARAQRRAVAPRRADQSRAVARVVV